MKIQLTFSILDREEKCLAWITLEITSRDDINWRQHDEFMSTRGVAFVIPCRGVEIMDFSDETPEDYFNVELKGRYLEVSAEMDGRFICSFPDVIQE